MIFYIEEVNDNEYELFASCYRGNFYITTFSNKEEAKHTIEAIEKEIDKWE